MPDKAAGGEWKKGGKRKKRMGKKQERNRVRGGKRKNKTIYTAAPVVCGWVRAVMKKLVAKDPTALTKIFLPSYWRFLLCMIYILFFGVGSPLVALKMLINDVFNFPRDL